MDVTPHSNPGEPGEVLEQIRRRYRIERRQVTDERQALEAFARDVRSIPIESGCRQSASATAGGQTAPAVVAQRQPLAPPATGGIDGLATVRDAYESTVMGVPHYEDEYGDTYAESVAAEFGPTLGAALTEGSQFDPQCRDTLLVAVKQAIDERAALLGAVEAEHASVREAGSILEPVIDDLAAFGQVAFDAESLGSLDAYRARLATLRDRCDEAAALRQAAIRDQRTDLRLPAESLDVPTYLYRDFESDYPLLSLIASLGDRIDRIEGEIASAVATCQ